MECYKPYQTEVIRRVRVYLRPEAKIYLHSCDSVHWAIEDFIEIGVDIVNPVQPLARNMEPWRLKRDYGDKIAFFGGFDVQELLPLGTVEQVREGVKRLIQEYAPGGGYIFAPLHVIDSDCPPEKFINATKENRADIIAMSALLSTTRVNMEDIIQKIRTSEINHKIKVMVGGAPVTQDFADVIGVDGYAPDAGLAVKKAKELLGVDSF